MINDDNNLTEPLIATNMETDKYQDEKVSLLNDTAVEASQADDNYKEPEEEEFTVNRFKAILFINIYCIFDTVDNIFAKRAMELKVGFIDIALARILCNFISAVCFVVCLKQQVTNVPKQFRIPVTLRSILQLAAQIANVFAISLLPLSILTIVQNTQAIWTSMLGMLVNNEKCLKIELLGIVACFTGVILMATANQKDEDSTDSLISESDLRAIGILIMSGVALADATNAVLARKMQTLHFSIIMFWFSGLGVILLLLFISISSLIQMETPSIFTYTAEQYYLLLGIGVCSALNLTCLVIAYQNDKSATVSLIAYIALVYAFLADVLIFDQSFVFQELAGALIITFFNIMAIVLKATNTWQC